jgi:hypothetical protein
MLDRWWAQLRNVLRRSLGWGVLALGPNLLWEVVQLPLYSIWVAGTRASLAYAVAHCTVGDGLIAATTFLTTAAIVRSTDWPRVAPLRGLGLVTAIGLTYTVWSEYRNVYVAKHWAYASTMPVVAGIGLLPILQWLLLPAVTLWLPRRLQRGAPSHR